LDEKNYTSWNALGIIFENEKQFENSKNSFMNSINLLEKEIEFSKGKNFIFKKKKKKKKVY
jgi:hypothetical protein